MTDSTDKHGFSVNTLLAGMLAIVFVVLKLTGVIGWSWWWVLAPLWMPLGIGLAAVAIYLVYYLTHKDQMDKKRQKKEFYEAMGKWRTHGRCD